MPIILSTQSPPDEELVRGGPSNIQGSAYKQKQATMISSVQPVVEGMATAAMDSSNGQLYCKFRNDDGEQCKKLGGEYTVNWCNGVAHSLGIYKDDNCKEEINALSAMNGEELKELKAYEAKFNAALEAYTTAYHDYSQERIETKKVCGWRESWVGFGIKDWECWTSSVPTIPMLDDQTAKTKLATLEATLNELAQGMWEKQQKVNNLDLKLQSRITERRGELMTKNSSLEAAQEKLDALARENRTLTADATNKELEADSTYLRYGTFIAITVALGALSINLLSR